MEKDNDLKVIRFEDSNYLRILENAIPYGLPVLLENVEEHLEPSLEPVLCRQVFTFGGSKLLRLGEDTVEYSDDFRYS